MAECGHRPSILCIFIVVVQHYCVSAKQSIRQLASPCREHGSPSDVGILHGLQSAKMARYAGATALLPDSIFVTFMLTWIASRCIYFPFFIIRSTLFESAVNRHPPPQFACTGGTA